MAFLNHFAFRLPRRSVDITRGLGLLVALLAGSPELTAAPPLNLGESEIKAAALYNIIPFVDWPDGAFATPDAPVVIGILGQSAVASLIPRLVEGESWHGRPLVIEHYSSPLEVRECHLLFVAQSATGQWPRVLRALRDHKVLTVSDHENFAARGGAIQLSLVRSKLRLTVNLAATRQAEVTLSTKLLRLASVLGENGP